MAVVVALVLAVLAPVAGAPAPAPAGASDPPADPLGTVHPMAQVLHDPYAVAAAPDGNVWFRHDRETIGRIMPDGTMTTFPALGADGHGGIAGGPDGNVWYTSEPDHLVGRVTPAGATATFKDPKMIAPSGIAEGPDGNLWVTDPGADAIESITPNGVVTRYDHPSILDPGAITSDGVGNLWFVNGAANQGIGRISTAGVVTIFPVGAYLPRQLVVGPDGNVWYPAWAQGVVRLTPTGEVTVFPAATDHHPSGGAGIAVGPDGALWMPNTYFADYYDPGGPTDHQGWITRYATDGSILGTYDTGMDNPGAIVTGPDGHVWFANRPGPATPTHQTGPGFITSMTPAGVGTRLPAQALYEPTHVAPDASGGAYVVDARSTSGGALVHVRPAGLETIEPEGVTDVAAGLDGDVWFTKKPPSGTTGSISRIRPDGTVTPHPVEVYGNDVGPLSVGLDGTVWFAVTLPGESTTLSSIRRVTPSGDVGDAGTDTFAIGPARQLVAAPDGTLLVLSRNGKLGRLAGSKLHVLASDVTSVAVTAMGDVRYTTTRDQLGWVDYPGPYDVIGVDRPSGVVAGQDGFLWMLDPASRRVARVSADYALTAAIDVPATTLAAGTDDQFWYASPDEVGSIATGLDVVHPSGVYATVRGGAAMVRWQPTWWIHDGAEITAVYTVTAWPGGRTCVRRSGPLGCTVTGLTNGVPYTFTVTATNGAGTSAPSDPSYPVTPELADVPAGAAFHDEIAWLLAEGIATGFPDNTFHPASPVSRQAMAAFLYRAAGSPDGEKPTCAQAPFSDVAVGAAFCGEIRWLTTSGIATGFPDGTFRPTAPVTRRAMAAFLYRMAGRPKGPTPTCSAAPFSDVPVGAPFCGEITWLTEHKVANGYANGTYRPDAAVSRGAMAAFLQRLDGLHVELAP